MKTAHALALSLFVLPALLGAAELSWTGEQRALLSGLDPQGFLRAGRDIHIHVPPGYAAEDDRRYPVLYCFDGESALSPGLGDASEHALNIDLVHDRLVATGLIEPAIIVAIANASPSRRWHELGANEGRGRYVPRDGAEAMHHFIDQILRPQIDRRFRTRTDAAATGLQGCSMGGIAAQHLVLTRPERYGFAAVFSGQLSGHLIERIPADRRGYEHVRLWLDWGNEEGMFRPNNLFTPGFRALAARGWVEGRDLGFRLNHGGHRYRDWQAGVTPMLLFWLGGEQTIDDARVQTWGQANPEHCDPAAVGEYARLALRVGNDDGFEMHPLLAEWASTDHAVATVDRAREPGMPLIHGPGLASALASWRGYGAQLPIVGYDPATRHEHFPLPLSVQPPTLDGDLADWDRLALAADDAPYRFGARRHGEVLYLAVAVRDEAILASAERAPWQQDGIELRIDARPLPRLALGRGLDERFYLTLLAISPGSEDPTAPFTIPGQELPANAQVVCRTSDDGYVVEAAVFLPPLEVERAGWEAARVNLIVNDLDQAGGDLVRHHWRPDWRSEANQVGRGILVSSERP